LGYIIDTGILITHEDFQGRAQFGFKASSSWSSDDKNGHGTHVASTVGGVTYGVAKKVTLVAVKVLGDDGCGTNAGVIAGVDWAYGSHQARGSKKSVANMSLGGGYSGALNTAVTSAMKGGLFMVVAAGNENADACNGSPSSAKDVITVGATEQGFPTGDVRSYFSNYGVCVDIFAPGTEITAAWIGNTNRVIKTISGTSMASPHVCGVAALITAADPNAHWAQVATHLLGRGTQNKIQFECSSSACKASPNIMLFNNC
jgi:oryzin